MALFLDVPDIARGLELFELHGRAADAEYRITPGYLQGAADIAAPVDRQRGVVAVGIDVVGDVAAADLAGAGG
jgi:hypothetical protein